MERLIQDMLMLEEIMRYPTEEELDREWEERNNGE